MQNFWNLFRPNPNKTTNKKRPSLRTGGSTSSSSSSRGSTSNVTSPLAKANNSFGLELFGLLCNGLPKAGNVLVSPLSIGAALNMTALGTSDNALTACRQVLRWSLDTTFNNDEAKVRQAWKLLLESLDGRGVDLTIANSLWARDANTVYSSYRDILSQDFNAEMHPITTAEDINSWCAQKTQNLIPKMLDEIGDDVVLFIINAVYFKGLWKNPFEISTTKKSHFEGVTDMVWMMAQHRTDWRYTSLYHRGHQLQMIDLPYGTEGHYSCVVILPEKGVNIDSVISALDQETWQYWTQSLNSFEEGTLWLPRLQLSFGVCDLVPYLGRQGLHPLFDQGNLKRMFVPEEAEDVYVSRVLHKAVMELDEAGTTVVAAVTIAECIECVSEQVTFEMRCDRPFLLVIREVGSGLILFIAKVTNPQPK